MRPIQSIAEFFAIPDADRPRVAVIDGPRITTGRVMPSGSDSRVWVEILCACGNWKIEPFMAELVLAAINSPHTTPIRFL